jgi:hypothetical protein
MKPTASTGTEAPSVSGAAVMRDTRSDIIDAVLSIEKMMGALQAYRAELLVDAERWTDFTEQVTSSDPTAWNARAVAQKELESELACALRVPERTAQSLLGESRVLVSDLPATKEALRAGDISYRHAQKMIDHATDLPADARAGFEEKLLPFATRLTAARFDVKARKHRERFHPESIAERRKAAVDRRSVTFDPGRDGMGWLTAHLPAEQGVAIFNAITDAATQLQGATEARTLSQLRADVFADALLGGDATRGIVPTVMVTVPVLSLLGHSNEPAQLEGYGPIDIETAACLTANAPWVTRVLTHPETGVVLSMGRKVYKLPRRLRRWLKYRDGTCRFPGCGRPARKADIDHVKDWAFGGATNFDNLICLCPFHHKLKHNSRWKVELLDNGIVRWTSPDGRTYDTEPDNPIETG